MNGPSEEQIAAWKEEYENVFQIDSGKGEYYFRSINFAEYEKAIEIDNKKGSVEVDDFLVETALLYPEPTEENLSRMPAFFASTLSDYIIDFSCLGDAEHAIRKMNEERERVQDTKSVMMTFVLTAFPYRVEELEDESFFSLARKVALAEQVLQLRQAVNNGAQIQFQLGEQEEETEQPQQRPAPQDKNEEVLAKLRKDMDKAMSYVSPGQNVEYEG